MASAPHNGEPAEAKAAEDPTDLSTLIAQGEHMIEQLAEAHRSWGLGSADRWDLDQRTGIITWTFPDKIAAAPAQILGSFSSRAGSWRWARANESILPELSGPQLIPLPATPRQLRRSPT